jgi:hypothetical protein
MAVTIFFTYLEESIRISDITCKQVFGEHWLLYVIGEHG